MVSQGGCLVSRPKGIQTGSQVAASDYQVGNVRYLVKSKPYPGLVDSAKAVSTKHGVQIEFAIVGSGALEDDEDFVDGYNNYMLQKIANDFGSEFAEHLAAHNWTALIQERDSGSFEETAR